jgi:hypothetical protein
MIATATAEAVSLLSINRRIQMRQNNVDFQNRELRTNILALLLVTTRRVTPDDIKRVYRHCDFPDSSATRELHRHQEQTAIAPLNQCDRLAATPEMAG